MGLVPVNGVAQSAGPVPPLAEVHFAVQFAPAREGQANLSFPSVRVHRRVGATFDYRRFYVAIWEAGIVDASFRFEPDPCFH